MFYATVGLKPLMGVAMSARKPRIITPRIITEIIPKNEGNFDQIVLNIKALVIFLF